jgi:hypothetical protein
VGILILQMLDIPWNLIKILMTNLTTDFEKKKMDFINQRKALEGFEPSLSENV